MQKLIMKIKSLPRYSKVCFLISAVSHFMVYYIPLLFGKDTETMLTSRLDELIPCVPVFVWPYVLAFPFWVLCFGFMYTMNEKLAKRLVVADLIAKTVCVFCFCLFPCTLVLPEAVGLSAWALKIVRACDKPTNLFPSMHCYLSCMCALPLFSRYAGKTSLWFKLFCTAFALLICVSTLFTKQHVFLDVWTGIADTVGAWLLSCLIWKIIDSRKGAANK